jgi:hypothetical protein
MLTIRICMDGAYATLEHGGSNERGHHFSTPDGRFCLTLAPDFQLPAEPEPEPVAGPRVGPAWVVEQARATLLRHGKPVDDEDLKLHAEKYAEYGVPADQSLRTILRHHGVSTQTTNRDDLQIRLGFGRHRGLTLADVPIGYLNWLAAEPRAGSSFEVPHFVRVAADRLLQSGARHD